LCDWAYNTTADDVKKLKEEQQRVKDEIKANEEKEFADGGIYNKEDENEITESVSDVVNDIISSVKELTLFDKRDAAIDAINDIINSKDPRTIKDVNVAKKVKAKLDDMKRENE